MCLIKKTQDFHGENNKSHCDLYKEVRSDWMPLIVLFVKCNDYNCYSTKAEQSILSKSECVIPPKLNKVFCLSQIVLFLVYCFNYMSASFTCLISIILLVVSSYSPIVIFDCWWFYPCWLVWWISLPCFTLTTAHQKVQWKKTVFWCFCPNQ